jgi:hypothetical protein
MSACSFAASGSALSPCWRINRAAARQISRSDIFGERDARRG